MAHIPQPKYLIYFSFFSGVIITSVYPLSLFIWAELVKAQPWWIKWHFCLVMRMWILSDRVSSTVTLYFILYFLEWNQGCLKHNRCSLKSVSQQGCLLCEPETLGFIPWQSLNLRLNVPSKQSNGKVVPTSGTQTHTLLIRNTRVLSLKWDQFKFAIDLPVRPFNLTFHSSVIFCHWWSIFQSLKQPVGPLVEDFDRRDNYLEKCVYWYSTFLRVNKLVFRCFN